jgi:hypothetical protein
MHGDDDHIAWVIGGFPDSVANDPLRRQSSPLMNFSCVARKALYRKSPYGPNQTLKSRWLAKRFVGKEPYGWKRTLKPFF